MARFKNSPFAEALSKVFVGKVGQLRQLSAKARQERDYKYANQVDREIGKWQRTLGTKH